MFLARVTGSVIATQKLASMVGQKLLIVEPYRVDERPVPVTVVAPMHIPFVERKR